MKIIYIKILTMVLKQLFWLVAGAGVAAFPVHATIHQDLKREQDEIHNEFKRQRLIVFSIKAK